MANTISSQYMGLPVPIVSQDPGPQYATDLNSCLALLDQHDHSSGKGLQISPAGLNINTDLPFGSNNATMLRSSRYTAQGSPIGGASDVGCVYVAGVDLYYNDINGNQIRITASGSIVGTSGSISGLVAPASASYNSGSGKFVWQSAVSTSADMDMGSIILRDDTASSNGITIQPPAALAGNYSLTLPGAAPGTNNALSLISSSGVISFLSLGSAYTVPQVNSGGSALVYGTITRNSIASVGQQISASCGNSYSITTSQVTVTNLTVTITTTGRPVVLSLMSDGTYGAGSVGGQLICNSGSSSLQCAVLFVRGVTNVAAYQFAVNTTTTDRRWPASLYYVDVPTAGTYTYAVQAIFSGAGGSADLHNVVLCAYEL